MKIEPSRPLKLLLLLVSLLFTSKKFAQSADAEVSKEGTTTLVVPQAGMPSLLLTGIAAIGEQKFVYLSDPVTSQSFELVTGMPANNGIELLRVHDQGLVAGWKVLIRQQGTEHWLNFAAPSQLNTAGSLAILSATTIVPAAPPAHFKRQPAQNAGTMSNNTPSSAVNQRPVNSYPLPGGL